jgi:hypothetical protein
MHYEAVVMCVRAPLTIALAQAAASSCVITLRQVMTLVI